MFLHSEPSLIKQFLGSLFLISDLTNEKYTKGLVFGAPNFWFLIFGLSQSSVF